MEEIKFSTGKQEFRLNDQVSVSFNPTDAAFVERIYDVLKSWTQNSRPTGAKWTPARTSERYSTLPASMTKKCGK